MGKKMNLLGQKFGKLTVIEETRKNNKLAWRCLCECGGERIAYSADLMAGKTTSCGCGKRLDITNQKYGKLTALHPTDQKTSSGIVWECICDCGNTHYTTPHALRSGNVLSCGCGRSEAVAEANRRRAHNLLGQKFGQLLVIAPSENSANGRTQWKCKCDCGRETITTTKDLMDGHSTSCGCFSGSKGENKIAEILSNHNIFFKREASFNDFIFPDSQKKARYDFYLPDFNCLIEYDGKQHFSQGTGYYDNMEKFAKTQEHDYIKNEYAKNHNIALIRIPYTHYENIELADLLPLTSSFVIQ